MDFTFDADPHLDIALGLEGTGEIETYESENGDGVEIWDLSTYDPMAATNAKPGSEDKVKMLSARYAAGVPLWDPEDRYDHSPDQLAENASLFDFGGEDADAEEEPAEV